MRTVGGVLIVAFTLTLVGGAHAKAPSFQLVFNGKHARLTHVGTFTTSSSWCSSGTASDVSVEEETALRQFVCTEGGDFQAKVSPLPGEHGGSGTWQIIGGSGTLTELRGKGTFLSTLLSGSQNDPSTITFRSTWEGVADFDTTPPTVVISSATARKVKSAKLTYDLRVGLALSDNDGDVVSYILQVADQRKPSRPIVYRLGHASGTLQLHARMKVSGTTRGLLVRVDATDAVGNAATVTKTLRLH